MKKSIKGESWVYCLSWSSEEFLDYRFVTDELKKIHLLSIWNTDKVPKMLEAEVVKKGPSHAIWERSPELPNFQAISNVGLKPHLTRVLLAEDHPLVRNGMKYILQNCPDIVVVGEASNGLQALALIEELVPDVLLLDIEMPIMDGTQVAARLQELNSSVRILVLSAHDDKQYIQSMFDLGASGYLLKEDAPDILVEAIRGVARGDISWVSQQVKEKIS